MSYPLQGDGFRGQIQCYRVCPTCGRRKATSAFRIGVAVCRKCDALCSKCGERPKSNGHQRCRKCRNARVESVKTNLQHQELAESRHTFEHHMVMLRATAADRIVVEAACERYGLKEPCPDDILTAYAGDGTKLYRELFHAVVLLAHERNNRGRLGGYKIGSRGRGRGAQPNDSGLRSGAAA